MTASWYVMQSKPRKEEFLCDQLLAHDLESYCPLIPVHTVNPRARQTMPYFPGYVFARVDLDRFQLSTLRWLPGALGVVSMEYEPVSVPESLLAAIRLRVDEIGDIGADVMFTGLKMGDHVKIQYGPFAGYEAIFDVRLPGTERVRVLLSLLRGRQMPVELPYNYIELAAQH
jgi:transcriptional antiterminator RfaH